MNNSFYIAWPGEGAGRERLGGKAAALEALSDTDLPVPAWFALTPRAFSDSLPDSLPQTARHDGAGQNAFDDDTLTALAPSAAVQEVLHHALARLQQQTPADNVCLAVRSSAPDEDGAAHSFAGQLASFLGVAPTDVSARVADVWRSAFSESVRAYRRARGLPETPSAPAVLVQRMVRARSAGVAFSADPTGGGRSAFDTAIDTAVVSAVRGLGSVLVEGDETGDTYRVDRSGAVTECSVQPQQHQHCRLVDGELHTAPLPEETESSVPSPVLTNEEAGRVAALARRAEHHFDAPQDIEWAFDDDRLYLLQSRPITAFGAESSPATRRQVEAPPSKKLWDNSNIAESYGGVTTPLTFSFARRAYRAVYRSFCRALGVPRAKVEARADVFRSMIGLVRGRLYYNLESWYEVLRLLPGFRFNRAFMEGMMGVREQLPEGFLPKREAASPGEKARDACHFGRSAFKLAQAHRRIGERARGFRRHVDRTLAAPTPSAEAMRLEELAARYRHLEDELLARWDVPIINDFLTMIFFGLSGRLLEAWGPQEDAAPHPSSQLHSALLAGARGIVSAEPVRCIRDMADAAAGDAALVEVLAGGTRAALEEALRTRPAFRKQYETYLERFGDRCLGELKLESRTLREDPMPLVRAVGVRARRHTREHAKQGAGDASKASLAAQRADAQARLAEALRGHPVRKRVMRWSLRHARARIATRENLRFERTRVFGAARRLFLEMGHRLAAAGFLEQARDVFYLEVEELLGFVQGTSAATDLAGLAAVRESEFARYRDQPAPPDRFVTRGAVPLNECLGETIHAAAPAAAAPETAAQMLRTGQACGGGVARGPARVVDDPRAAALTGDEILIARRTDPGWTPLFASCRGVVVERGNLLSHAAVLAREMGLPAVVGVEDATRWLGDAGEVEVDGRAGTVRRVDGGKCAAESQPANERPRAEVAT